MATLALGLAGSAIAASAAGSASTVVVAGITAGALGAAIGSAIGGVIDSFLIMPMLFPSDTLKGPRLVDGQMMTASEGSPMKWVIGPQNRVSGTPIWMSEIIEVKSKKKVGKGGGKKTVTNYLYYIDIAIGLADARNFNIDRVRRVWADTKLIYDRAPTDKYESITFYDGSQTTGDPVIQSYKGAANTPVYKKTAYMVIKKLALADYGNRVPTISVEMVQDTDVSLREAVTLIMDRQGFDPTEFDATRLPNCFRGMVLSGPQSAADSLRTLAIAYSFVISEDGNGKIVFTPRGDETEFVVDEGDLASVESGDQVKDRLVSISDANDYTIPSESHVRFVCTDIDLQQGSESHKREDHTGEETLVADLPVTLSSEEANKVARQMLWAAEGERQRISLTLPPSYIGVREGNVLTFSLNGDSVRVFCSEVNRGFNGLIEISGFIQNPGVYDQTGVATAVGYESNGSYTPPDLLSYAADLPALTDDLVVSQKVGVFWATTPDPENSDWAGASLFVGSTTTNGTEEESTAATAILGIILSGPQDGPWLFWDEVNHIDVEILGGSVSSVSEEECLSGYNRIALESSTGEWEIIGFQNVTVLGTNQYRLSRLIRGLRGTEFLTGKHTASGAKCIVLEEENVSFYDVGLSNMGRNLYYTVVPVEGSLSEYDHTLEVCNGATLRPFAPFDLQGDLVSGDLVLSWTRRGKRFVSAFSPADSPLSPDESPETYRIQVIYGGEYGTVKRSTTVTGTTTWTYTTSMQSSDGFSSGAPVRIEVNQVSSVVGHGTKTTGVFTL